jgi:hypothetical protein
MPRLGYWGLLTHLVLASRVRLAFELPCSPRPKEFMWLVVTAGSSESISNTDHHDVLLIFDRMKNFSSAFVHAQRSPIPGQGTLYGMNFKLRRALSQNSKCSLRSVMINYSTRSQIPQVASIQRRSLRLLRLSLSVVRPQVLRH